VEKDHSRYLTALRAQVDRVAELMQELIEYGRPHIPHLATEKFASMVEQAVESCRSLARRRQVGVQIAVPEGLVVTADRRRLFQVLRNVVENAVEHSPQGAQVTVVARETSQGGQPWVECVVHDSGPGIPPESLGQVFEPYFSLRRGGTGLGLAIARRIVREHKGSIAVANAPEGGAVVTVRLPVASS